MTSPCPYRWKMRIPRLSSAGTVNRGRTLAEPAHVSLDSEPALDRVNRNERIASESVKSSFRTSTAVEYRKAL